MRISIVEYNGEKYLQHSKSKRFIFKFHPNKEYKTAKSYIGWSVRVYKYIKYPIDNNHWEYLCRLEDFLLDYGKDYLSNNTLCTMYDDLVEYIYENQPNKKEKPEYHIGDKVTVRIEYNIQIPKTCADCPFYSEREYRNHMEIGFVACCELGSMSNIDTRFKSYKNKKFEQCKIEEFIVEDDKFD